MRCRGGAGQLPGYRGWPVLGKMYATLLNLRVISSCCSVMILVDADYIVRSEAKLLPNLASSPHAVTCKSCVAQLVTTPVYAAMKREIKARLDGGWSRVDWALPTRPQLRDLEVVHGRMVYLNPKVH